jgi:fatty-acyl-CoA synthase
MDIVERLSALRQTGEEVRWQVEAVNRVLRQTGLPQAINRHGALHLLKSLPGLRISDPSLLFRFFAHNDPHRVGLVGVSTPQGGALREDRAYSFHEINERIDRIATALWMRGVRPGDRVLVMVKNRPEFVLLQAAGGRLGCAAVSVSYRSTPRELAYLAHHSGARALFFDVEVAEHVHEAAPDLSAIPRERCIVVGGEAPPFPTLEALLREGHGVPPRVEEEPAVVMYTSGTTGKPKGAVRKFARGAMLSVFAFIGETPMQVGDVHLAACPLYHATAFGFVTISYILRSTVVVMREFRPEAFWKRSSATA